MRGVPHAVLLVLAGALVAAAQSPDNAWSHPDSAPIRFLAGDDAGPDALSMYVTSYVISDNGTSIALALRGVAGATLRIDSLFKLHNADGTPRAVALNATPVRLPHALAYSVDLQDPDAPMARLDLTAPSPAHLVIPAGATRDARLTLTFAPEASPGDAAAPTTIITLHAV